MKFISRLIASIAVIALLFAPALSADYGMSVSASSVSSDTAQDTQPQVPTISAKSACVLDASTGQIIYALNEHEKMPMASTTKIMTCLLALESGDIGREITVTQEMLGADGTKLGLKLDDQITLYDLICAAMVLSGNDAADAIAVAVGGSKDAFVSMMNERAAEIGMFNTHFDTPSGLDEFTDAHYSTAYDMCLLGMEAAKNPDLIEITSATEVEIYVGNPKVRRVLTSHNYLLTTYKIKGCDGLKTGYTMKAGRCLVSHVVRDGVNLVCTTLNAPNYWTDHRKLYNYSFELYDSHEIDANIGNLHMMVVGGAQQTVPLACEASGSFAVLKSQKDSVYRQVTVNKFEYAPVSVGQVVGKLQYVSNDVVVAEFPITVAQDVESTTDAWLSAYVSAIKFKVGA